LASKSVQMQPFMDRPQKPINRLSGAIFKITREPLKLRRHVKHCKKGFRAIFPTISQQRYVYIWKFWEKWMSLFSGSDF